MGIRRKEEYLTFARIERKASVLRLVFKLNQSILSSIQSSRDRGGERSDSQVDSIRKAADGRR